MPKLSYHFVGGGMTMNKRKLVALFAISLVMIAAASFVFAQPDNVKTHEYNFLNKAVFNISDDLTNETELNISQSTFEVGTSYTYPDGKVTCSLWFVGEDGTTDFGGHQENSSYEKFEGNKTSQGYKTYIFRDSNQYDVFIDLNNLTMDNRGVEMQYYYFRGTFETLDEVQIFIGTFKINEATN